MKLNVDSLFNQGYAVNRIDLDVANILLDCLKSSVFENHGGFHSDHQPPTVVSWAYQKEKTPTIICDFWKNLARSPLFDLFTINYGDFSHLQISAHRYLKNQTLLWHHDFHEALPINNILYLADHNINPDDGGLLEIGKWKADRNGWGRQHEVTKTVTILPEHGTLVTLFNMNPSIVHSVTPLKKDYGRYSLICRMGYNENVSNSKITSLM